MAITAGTKLGSYEVLASLGAGGMGEVWRARDTKLGRDVALKVLPVDVAGDKDRLRRFEQEARAASGLNHPNIVTIHDIGTSDSTAYIAMELVDGRTLRELLSAGPLAVRRILEIGAQTVDGLAKAHGAGIVHRDLKPENLMVTKDGFVKILDFGLAKLSGTASGDLTNLSTMVQETKPGTVLGTVGYMSPEQASGQPVDFRSDQFSLGSILYEMATGVRAFAKPTAAQAMAAIIQDEPEPIAKANPKVPAPLRWIVERCLAKDAEHRYASTRDLARELATLRDHASELSTEGAAMRDVAAGRGARRRRALLAVAAVAAVLAVAAGLLRPDPPRRPGRVVASLVPPENLSTVFGGVALSPDGGRIAFTTDSEGDRVWIRRLDDGSERRLAGTEKAYAPFWSPDGKSFGFFTESKLKRVSVDGGPSLTICDAPYGRGATWSPRGDILFTPNVSAPLFLVSAAGGPPSQVTRLSVDETSHRWPFFLPDGKHFLYVAMYANGKEKSALYAGSVDASEAPRRLAANASGAVYAPSGHLVFVRDEVLLAQPFDVRRLRTTGDPISIEHDKVDYNYLGAVAPISVSADGVLAYRPGVFGPNRLLWLSRSGETLSTGPVGHNDELALSPDGKRIAIVRSKEEHQEPDVWIQDTDDQRLSQLTVDATKKQHPTWSPDGKWVAYGSERSGGTDLYRKAADGGSPEELLVHSDHLKEPTDWSRDGRLLLYDDKDPEQEFDLWILPMSGDRKPYVFLKTPHREEDGHFSPDGRFVAYQSDESGRFEVYVKALAGAGGPWKVSVSGGVTPRWRADGKELFYISTAQRLMAVDVTAGAEFRSGPPRTLFALPPEAVSEELPSYDVSPDGQRFCVVARVGASPRQTLTVVVNWSAGLR